MSSLLGFISFLINSHVHMQMIFSPCRHISKCSNFVYIPFKDICEYMQYIRFCANWSNIVDYVFKIFYN